MTSCTRSVEVKGTGTDFKETENGYEVTISVSDTDRKASGNENVYWWKVNVPVALENRPRSETKAAVDQRDNFTVKCTETTGHGLNFCIANSEPVISTSTGHQAITDSNQEHAEHMRNIPKAPKAAVEGFLEYKWGMSLSQVLKIKRCLPAFLTLDPHREKSHDSVSFSCKGSGPIKDGYTGFMDFKDNRLQSVTLQIPMNRAAIDYFISAVKTVNKNAKTLGTFTDKNRPTRVTDFRLSGESEFASFIKTPLRPGEHTFRALREELTALYGMPSEGMPANELAGIEACSEQKSGFDVWAVNEQWEPILVNYLCGENHEKFATFRLTSDGK